MTQNFSIRKKAALISMWGGVFMLLCKMTAFIVTGSAAIFSDALESVIHIAATGMALFSIIYSAKPADKDHPYGHGNIEYFSAAVEGLLIILAAIGIIYYAAEALINGIELKQLDIGIYVTAFAGAFNFFLGFYLVKVGKKTGSLILEADGKHILTDSYTSIGVVAGVIVVFYTGLEVLDPLVAMAVASNIIFTGYSLIKIAVRRLMNESDPDLISAICSKLNDIRKSSWVGIHRLRAWESGDNVFIDFHLILPYYFTIREAHEEEIRIRQALKEIYEDSELIVHQDHCNTAMCRFCGYEPCGQRKSPKIIEGRWEPEYLTALNDFGTLIEEK